MVKLIYSPKGTGKTKKLIDMANEELNTAKGDIVFIDDNKRYMYDVKHQIRFVDAEDYKITTGEAMYGLICGMVAQDFDIESIYIDAFLKITGLQVEDTEDLIKKIDDLSKKSSFNAIIIISGDPKTAPEFLKAYM